MRQISEENYEYAINVLCLLRDKLPNDIRRAYVLDVIEELESLPKQPEQEVQGEGTGCTCQLCGSKYTVDFNVPDDVWETIREGKNLLCPVCIARKIEDLPGFAAYELQTTKQGEG